MKKIHIILLTAHLLLFLYIYKINEIAIDYKMYILEKKREEMEGEDIYDEEGININVKYPYFRNKMVYNKCVTTKTPKVSGMLETAQYLFFTNSSFINFGDSEIDIMMKRNNINQKYDSELNEKLIKAFFTDDPKVMIGIPNIFDGFPKLKRKLSRFWTKEYIGSSWLYKNLNFSKQYFDAFVTSVYFNSHKTSCELVGLTYGYLKEVFRDKDLIILRMNNSEVYVNDVYEYAASQKIIFSPRKNMWDKYDELKEMLMKEDPEALYVIETGIASQIMVIDLVKDGRRALDLGQLAKDYNLYMKFKNIPNVFK